MRSLLNDKRGFNSVDVAVTIGVVGLMVVAMAPIVRRAGQAKVKAAVDALGAVQGSGDLVGMKKMTQYEPYYASSDMTTTRNDKYTEKYDKGAYTKTGNVSDATRTGSQTEGGSADLNRDAGWQ